MTDEPTAKAITPAVCVNRPRDIEAAMEQTRTTLLAQVGDRQRSRIGWAVVKGLRACLDWLAELPKDTDEARGVAAAYEVWLLEHGDDAVVVAAYCDAVTL